MAASLNLLMDTLEEDSPTTEPPLIADPPPDPVVSESGARPGSSSSSKHPPSLPPKDPTPAQMYEYVARINAYINRLGYHHVGEPGIRVHTHLSLRHHMETARQVIKAGDNIKCLHALLLGIYLTNCTSIIERFPINFKSKVNGKEYRHVVLGIYLYGAYGALGLSRDPGLQDKPPTYTRLSELLSDYCRSYEKSGHTLLEIKVGGIIPRDATVQSGIPWRLGILNMSKFPEMKGFETEADKVARLVKAQMGQLCIRPRRQSVARNSSLPVHKHPRTEAPPTEGVAISKAKLPSTSSKLHGSTSRMLSKSSSEGKVNAKKKKVAKYKRFAEP